MIHSRKITIFCSLFLLIGGILFHFHQQKSQTHPPIKIYKTAIPDANTALPDPIDSTHEIHSRTENDPTDKDSAAALARDVSEVSLEKRNFTDVETQNPRIPARLHEEPVSVSETSASNETLPNHQEWLNNQILEIMDRWNAKYPDLVDIPYMSKEEFFEAYPTREERDKLLKQAQQAEADFLIELRGYTKQLSPDVKAEGIAFLKDYFTGLWGEDAADQLIAKIRRDLGL